MGLAQKGKTIFLHYNSYLIIVIYMFFSVAYSIDTLSLGQSLSTDQTLISNGTNFELGFFSPGNSTNYYVGIWYNNIPVQTVVWVANRDNPIPFSSFHNSTLLLSNGTLRLYAGLTRTIVWESLTNIATQAILLHNGNFVLRGASGVLWQSFDYPTDTWLPGGSVGFDKTNNRSIALTCWTNSEDPAPGIYSLGIDPNTPQLFMMRNLTTRYWRGLNYSFLPEISANDPFNNYSYVSNDDVDYFTYSSINSILARVMISSLGSMQGWIWTENTQAWNIYMSEPRDVCGSYEICGPFGVCNIESSPICSCLPGFVPQFPMDWDRFDTSSGCVRRNPLLCDNNDRFLPLTNIIPADSQSLAVDNTACEFACSMNCSCNAYSFSATGGGCLLWTGDLLDLQNRTNGSDFFLKLNRVEFAVNDNHSRKKKILRVAIPLSVALVLVITSFVWLRRKKLKQTEARRKNQDLLLLNLDNNGRQNPSINDKSGKEQKVLELPMFSFSSISTATEKFSAANKLGEGGFGPVYKGSLLNGQSVAVKRLAKLSGQGLEELRNEAILIAKLQHKNLVRLLGYCTEKDEKILIYEYLPNKSLDSFLFDPNKKEVLDWSKRVKIIEGIAQGLLYLHEYSRLRIVHRDLKAGNILLDGDMNPKISDFGMARIFDGNVLDAKTNHIVGTYGYMSPEYAMGGRFSVKSDIFAFGVLLLEILSSKKNTGFHDSDFLSLLGYVWNLWENERALELIDPILKLPNSSFMPLRYINVGLLCVEESPDDRPTISHVLAMLSNEQTMLASPKKPAFTTAKAVLYPNSGSDKAENGSININLTNSVLVPR